MKIATNHQVFKTRRVRYARGDELELYSSSITSPVKRRHQLVLRFLLLFTHCRWMNTSTARQECATLSVYTTSGTTDTTPMLSFAGCQNSTALTSLHCSVRSGVEVNFVDVCGFDPRRGSPVCSRFLDVLRFSRRRLRFSLRTHTSLLLYSDTILCPGDNFIIQTRANGCIGIKFCHNECTQHVVSLHGGHVVPSALRSSTATVKAIIAWNSWSRRYPPQMRENLLPVRIIRREKATSS